VTMEEIARVPTRHPPSDRLPAALPAPMTAQRDLLSARPVRQVMTTPLHTIPAHSTLGEVVLAMVDRGIHHLPLARQGRLVGIVTDTPTCCGASPTIPCSSAASSTGRPAPSSWPPPPVR
jgi:CBS domain-containing protein